MNRKQQHIKRILAEDRAEIAMINEWVDVSDHLPDETDKYIIMTNKGKTKTIWFIRDVTGGRKFMTDDIVTHWKNRK